MMLFASLVLCCVVCWYRRKVQMIKNDHGWKNMISQLELSDLQHKRTLIGHMHAFMHDNHSIILLSNLQREKLF